MLGGMVCAGQSVCAAPANDAFSAAALLSGTSVTATGANGGASKEPGEPNHAGRPGGRSVWWLWTAPGAGEAELQTDTSTFDTLLGVYAGSSVSDLVEVASNDDHADFGWSRVRFATQASATYRIAVDGFDAGGGAATGTVKLALIYTAGPISRPVNDLFASASVANGMIFNLPASNQNALREPGEPLHASAAAGGNASVWWVWTPPASGDVRLDTRGSNFDTLLAVYRGTALTSLVEVASSDDIDPLGGIRTSEVAFWAIAGNTYVIAVDGYDGSMGQIALRMRWERALFRVASAHGSPLPAAGVYTNAWGTMLTNTCTALETHGPTQYVCRGWALSGGVAVGGQAAGTATSMVMAHTNEIALTWRWGTNYWLDTGAGPHGSVSPADGWRGAGSNVTVKATADAYYHFAGWTGPGTNLITAGGAQGETVTVGMSAPATLSAAFQETLAAHDTPEWWLALHGWTNNFDAAALADADGDGMATWAEFHADTIPTNRASVLAITGIERVGANVTVRWKGGTAARQRLEIRPDLADPAQIWSPLLTNTPPTAATHTFTHTAPVAPTLFYRVTID